MASKKAIRFKIPGGIIAIASWREGDSEGEIYVDDTWQKNHPIGGYDRGVVESLANKVVCGSDIEWNWQPIEILDSANWA